MDVLFSWLNISKFIFNLYWQLQGIKRTVKTNWNWNKKNLWKKFSLFPTSVKFLTKKRNKNLNWGSNCERNTRQTLQKS